MYSQKLKEQSDKIKKVHWPRADVTATDPDLFALCPIHQSDLDCAIATIKTHGGSNPLPNKTMCTQRINQKVLPKRANMFFSNIELQRWGGKTRIK